MNEEEEINEDHARIQVQDYSGVWRTFATTTENEQDIFMRMIEMTRRFPHHRIRAIDRDGNILNIT